MNRSNARQLLQAAHAARMGATAGDAYQLFHTATQVDAGYRGMKLR